jgi:hypothetical protein
MPVMQSRIQLTLIDYAIASSVPLGALNYFLVGWLNGDKYYVESWKSKLSTPVASELY